MKLGQWVRVTWLLKIIDPWRWVRLKFLVTRQLELITRHNRLLWGLRCPFSSTEGVGTKTSSMQQRRKWVWKSHPHSKGLPYHWTNESSRWYPMLTSRLLTQWRLQVMACNIWSMARLPGSRLQSSVGWLLRKHPVINLVIDNLSIGYRLLGNQFDNLLINY